MDVQKTMGLSLSVVNFVLFMGSSLFYTQSINQLKADVLKLQETVTEVEKKLGSHVSTSVGATNSKVSDLKRQLEDAQKSAKTLRTELRLLADRQAQQVEQAFQVLTHVEGVTDEEKKALAKTLKQLQKASAPPARRAQDDDDRPRRGRSVRFEDDEEEEEEEEAPAPVRRGRAQEEPEDDEEERLEAIRRRRQRQPTTQ
jgi:uncharacterized phage infection (PIP) family protein YhgE